MDGVHDLGGLDGFGPVTVEEDEPVFHAPWERRVFGLVAMITGQRLANVHAFRHAIERMDPVHYLASPYYEHWLTAAATLLVERGFFTRAELDARAGGPFTLSRPVHAGAGGVAAARAAAESPPTAASGGDVRAALAPRFAVGDAVVVRDIHPHGHTRCPRYVRGKRGIVVRLDGAYPLPDAAAHDADRCKEPTYDVRFDAHELWGDAGEPGAAIHVDLWEGYLERA